MAPTLHSIVDYMRCWTFHMFMNVFVLAMCCLKYVNMLWMMTKFLWVWVIESKRCPNKFTKKIFGQKNLGKGGRIGENIYRTRGFCQKNFKYLSKQGLQAKSLCFKNVLNSKKLSLYVITSKKWWHCNNAFLRPKFRLL
jgi:hypothetical protein